MHKGYVTDEHSAALLRHGPCAEHRFSYVNVAAASGRGNRPPRARRPAVVPAPASLFDVVPLDDTDAVHSDGSAADAAGASGRG